MAGPARPRYDPIHFIKKYLAPALARVLLETNLLGKCLLPHTGPPKITTTLTANRTAWGVLQRFPSATSARDRVMEVFAQTVEATGRDLKSLERTRMTLLGRIKAKIIGRNTISGDAQSYQYNMATFVGLQLNTRFEKPSKAFPALMTNTNAAGYLFGFHLACAQSIYRRNTDKCLSQIESSYVELFGEPAGRALFPAN